MSTMNVPLRSARRTQLVGRITPSRLGFTPEKIWCVSPSRRHRTKPYPFPQKIIMGCVESFESRAKFTPPPFAAIIEGQGRRSLISIKARPGWHRWNIVTFAAENRDVEVIIEFEGHTPLSQARKNVRVQLFPGREGETRHELLARGLKAQYPAAYRWRPGRRPKWWSRPIYCGVGDQAANSIRFSTPLNHVSFGESCNQANYERGLARLIKAGVPIGTTTIDAGWSIGDTWDVDKGRWPDLRGFIDREHAAGRRVLLWIATWYAKGIAPEWCLFEDGRKISVDPTHPGYRRFLARQVHYMLSPDRGSLNADGFKIDQLRRQPMEVDWKDQAPSSRGYRPKKKPKFTLARDGWGAELLYQLQKDIYLAAKAAKPDALINSSTVHPYFYDTLDQVRLHDIEANPADPLAAMGARADLARAALPHHLIDADDWLHSDYDKWLDFTIHNHVLGVPCIFYSEHFVAEVGKRTRPIPLRDLRRIARAWTKAL